MRHTAIAQFALRQLGQRAHCAKAAQRWSRQCSTRSLLCAPTTPIATSITRQLRCASDSSEASYRPLTDRERDAAENEARKAEIEARKNSQPAYDLTFTCNKCLERSTHRISKQGYHRGTVLVNCPGCKNKHLISDHLGIFSDRGITLEDIMKEKGELLQKGVLGADGDVEFYDAEAPPVVLGPPSKSQTT